MNHSRRFFSLALLLGIGVQIHAAERPNVVNVMTDDQGYPEVSAHGNPVLQTPNLDALHSHSLRLTVFHVAPMCAPITRCRLLAEQLGENGAETLPSDHRRSLEGRLWSRNPRPGWGK